MSSLPGFTLESFLMWNFDLVVEGDGSANPSLQIAEALGTATSLRKRISQDEFAPVVALYEPYREQIERRLEDFDEHDQSWRDYASSGFDFLPASLFDQSCTILKREDL